MKRPFPSSLLNSRSRRWTQHYPHCLLAHSVPGRISRSPSHGRSHTVSEKLSRQKQIGSPRQRRAALGRPSPPQPPHVEVLFRKMRLPQREDVPSPVTRFITTSMILRGAKSSCSILTVSSILRALALFAFNNNQNLAIKSSRDTFLETLGSTILRTEFHEDFLSFKIYVSEGQSWDGVESQRQTEIFCFLIYSPNGQSGWGWARPEPGA